MQDLSGTRRFAPGVLGGGRYQLDVQLAGGGMGEVYRATDIRLGRSVEVTLFPPGADPVSEPRIHHDMRWLANLSHPGLVPVHDFGVEERRAFLVTELIDGEPLGQVLARHLPPTNEVMTVGASVAEVLAYIHQQGIVHRGITASTVLLGRDGRVYLSGLGLSRIMAVTQFTPAGAAGDTAHRAPELVQGFDAGPAGDVYSLGLVLLQCVTLRVDSAVSRTPAVPSQLPPPLGRALSAMTQPDPAARPTAAQCVTMLTQPDLPGNHMEEPPPSRPSKTLRNWAIGGALLLLAVLLALTLFGGDDPTQATESERPPSVDVPSGDFPSSPGVPEVPDVEIPQPPDVDIPDIPDAPEAPNVDTGGLFNRLKDWFESWT